MRQPAPLSDDILLNGKIIDFDEFLLLLAFRTDSMYERAIIDRVEKKDGRVVVYKQNEVIENENQFSSCDGIGTCYAAIISKTDKELVFDTC